MGIVEALSVPESVLALMEDPVEVYVYLRHLLSVERNRQRKRHRIFSFCFFPVNKFTKSCQFPGVFARLSNSLLTTAFVIITRCLAVLQVATVRRVTVVARDVDDCLKALTSEDRDLKQLCGDLHGHLEEIQRLSQLFHVYASAHRTYCNKLSRNHEPRAVVRRS